MGLDNGILLRTKKPLPADCPIDLEGVREPDIYKGEWFEYEICYWRKCWNIREKMYYILYNDGAPVKEFDVNGFLSLSAFKRVWKMLNDFNEKNWKYPRETIWEWVEFEDHIERDLQVIEWLIQLLKDWDTDDYEIEFYDSY